MSVKRVCKFNIAIFCICLTLFLALTFLVLTQNSGMINIDNAVSQAVSQNRLRFFDYVFVILSYLGGSKSIAIFCVLLLLLPNRKKLGIPLALCVSLSAIINLCIKVIIARIRPEELFLTENTLGLTFPSGYSFPSGHAQTATVFYMTLAILLAHNYCKVKSKKVLTLCIFTFICLMTSFGRIYLGVHFLSDVIAGLCLAIAIIESFLYFYKIFLKRMNIIY